MIGAFFYIILPSKFGQFSSLEEFYNNSIFSDIWFKVVVMVSIAMTLILPGNLLKDVSELRFTTLLAVSCLFVITIVIIVQLSSFVNQFNEIYPEESYNWFDISKSFNSNLQFFSAIATVCFSTAPHYGVFQIYNKLTNNNKKRTRKVILSSLVFNCIIYIIVAVTGYLTQPVKTPDIIIERENLIGDKDIVMTIVRLIVIIMLILKIPIIWNSLRISIINLIFGNINLPLRRNLIVTISMTFVMALIGALYSKISDFIDILGGFTAVFFSFFFPCFIYVKSNNYKISHYKNIFMIIVCGVMIICGQIATGMVIRNIINQKKV